MQTMRCGYVNDFTFFDVDPRMTFFYFVENDTKNTSIDFNISLTEIFFLIFISLFCLLIQILHDERKNNFLIWENKFFFYFKNTIGEKFYSTLSKFEYW